MDCRNKTIEDLLADFVTGHVSAQDAATIRLHVAECVSCRRTLSLMEHLRVDMDEPSVDVGAPHIAIDTLAQYDRDPNALDEVVRSEVRAHLAECDQCASALEFVAGFDEELGQSAAAGEPEARSVRTPTYHVIAALGIAAILVMMIAGLNRFSAIPTDSDLSPQIGPSGQKIDFATHETMTLMTLRGNSQSVAKIPRSTADSIVVIGIPSDDGAAGFTYEYALTDENGTRIPAWHIQPNYDSAGIIRVGIVTRQMPDGLYTLQISKLDQTSARDTVREQHVFRLITQP